MHFSTHVVTALAIAAGTASAADLQDRGQAKAITTTICQTSVINAPHATSPAGRPEAPVAQPSAPAGGPETPAANPSAPAGMPEAPAGNPSAPAGQPEGASGHPSAPVSQPSGQPERQGSPSAPVSGPSPQPVESSAQASVPIIQSSAQASPPISQAPTATPVISPPKFQNSTTPKFLNSTTPKPTSSSGGNGGNGGNGGGNGGEVPKPTSTGFTPSNPGTKIIVPGLAVAGSVAMGLFLVA